MRRKILSSVELVLPPNVVETCYTIKRDVQARFRAINDEEKTKSEITIEKQNDDSIRIQVVVISADNRPNEEGTEEKLICESSDGKPSSNSTPRARPKRKARKWTKRKNSKANKQRTYEPEIVTEEIADTESKRTDCVPQENCWSSSECLQDNINFKVNEDGEGHSGPKPNLHEGSAPQDVETISCDKTKVKNAKTAQRRGRGRRGRGRALRFRGTTRSKAISSREVDSGNPHDNLIGENVSLNKKPIDNGVPVVPTHSETPKTTNETPSLGTVPSGVADSSVRKGRPRRQKKSIEKRCLPDNEKVDAGGGVDISCPEKQDHIHVANESRAPKIRKKGASSKPFTESCLSSTQQENDLLDQAARSSNIRPCLRKRKQTKPVNPKPQMRVVDPEVSVPLISSRLADIDETEAPPVETVPIDLPVGTSASGDNATHSLETIQDTAKGSEGNFSQDEEKESITNSNLKSMEKSEIKRSKTNSIPEPNPATSTAIQVSDNVVFHVAKDDTEIKSFQRVKTKAQLKQKPSELDFVPCIGKRSKPQISTNTNQIPVKLPVKKSPKSKTLARIWKTRKKSGFTHRKKSKVKQVVPSGDNESLDNLRQETNEADGNIINSEIKPESHVILTGKPLTRNGKNNSCAQRNEMVPSVKVPSLDQEDEKAQPPSDLGMPSCGDGLKLPQKKRHTAKLAAERKRGSLLQDRSLESVKRCTETTRYPQPASSRAFGPGQDEMTEEEFNETSAIESLIKLSNATEESCSSIAASDTRISERQNAPLETQDSPHDDAATNKNASREEMDAAVESIGECTSLEVGHDGDEVPMPTSHETIQHLMKIAVGDTKTTKVEERPSKRAYKREFKVQCRFCNVKVKDYGYLFRHVKKLHRDKGTEMLRHLEEIRPLMRTPCPICRKMVSSISNISSHIKQCHASKDSAVLCPICKKTYKTSVSLRQHLRQCHQPQQHRFFCHMCSANFTEKRSLKEHINCSHETTQVFQCDECGKSFLTKGRLRRHKYIHGEFRHKCKYCGKGFHLKDNMNKHIEIVHEKTHGKRFECPHCDKKFTVKGNMTQHIMGVHLKQFQYTCPQCQTGFRRKKDMLSHMVKHGETGSHSGDSNASSRSNDGETSNTDIQLQALDDTWHGSSEKTELITGLTETDEQGSAGTPRKTQIIVIAPKDGSTE